MGPGFADRLGESLIVAAVCIAVAGAIVGVGLWVAIPWLFHHVSIAFT